jgi:hypothetical protein
MGNIERMKKDARKQCYTLEAPVTEVGGYRVPSFISDEWQWLSVELIGRCIVIRRAHHIYRRMSTRDSHITVSRLSHHESSILSTQAKFNL